MNPYVAVVALIALILTAFGSFQAGVRWEKGEQAIVLADLKERALVAERAQGSQALDHAKNMRSLTRQLGDARAQVAAATTGRDCLGAGVVGVLNGLGSTDVPAAAGGPASAPAAAATDQDVGDALALCRGEYARVTDQLNKILDIEDKRAGDRAN